LFAQIDIFLGRLLGFLLEAVENKYHVTSTGHVKNPKGTVMVSNTDFHYTRANAWHRTKIVWLTSRLNFVYLKPRFSLSIQWEVTQPILGISDECNRFLARHADSSITTNIISI
tara:strand:- start:6436 stop:6777 length:342 start_codon:yes stop_codon:yes gene_type:complete